MRNPQQENLMSWTAIRNGHLPRYQVSENGEWFMLNTGDIGYLIEIANKYLGNNKFKTDYELSDHRFGYYLGNWMSRYVKEGYTRKMIRDLQDNLDGIRFYHMLIPAIPTRGKPLPYWEFSAHMEDFKDAESEAAYAFAHQLTFDGFKGLKRCLKKDCRRFFIRRRDAKWCSDKCGSHYRTIKNRKKRLG